MRKGGGRAEDQPDPAGLSSGQAACALPMARTRPDVEIEPLR